jgi:hypothetical protein
MMAVIYLYFALAFLVAIMAAIRGRAGWRWFLIALFLTPLISGILVLALPRQHEALHRLGNPAASPVIPMPMDAKIRVIAPPAASDRGLSFEIYVNGAHIGLVHSGGVVDFPVPSGRLFVEASDRWTASRPVAIETAPGQCVDLEVSSNNNGSSLALWSLFARHSPLALRRVPAPVASIAA